MGGAGEKEGGRGFAEQAEDEQGLMGDLRETEAVADLKRWLAGKTGRLAGFCSRDRRAAAALGIWNP